MCRHFRTRWPGVRTLFFPHLSICVTMGRWLSLMEPEFSHLSMDDMSNPILWSCFVLNEWTHVKNLEQYLTIMSGKHKCVMLLSRECIIHEGMDLHLNSILESLDKWVRSLGTGLTNLDWIMRKFAAEKLCQQELYQHSNAFLVKYAVFTLKKIAFIF